MRLMWFKAGFSIWSDQIWSDWGFVMFLKKFVKVADFIEEFSVSITINRELLTADASSFMDNCI